MRTVNILCVGDIVGNPGVEFIKHNLWRIRRENDIQCVVANGENSAKGNGIDINAANAIIDAGADMITTGNHVWRQKECYDFIDGHDFVLRPANFPDSCPGTGCGVIDITGYKILFVNLLGNLYMEPQLESPFVTADRIFAREKGRFDFAVIDIHAEATSEKIALGYYLDGRISAIVGTHTHVQTADERVLPGGTAYITDVGMTGPSDSVLGVKKDIIIRKFMTQVHQRFEISDNPAFMNTVIIDVEPDTGKSTGIERVNIS